MMRSFDGLRVVDLSDRLSGAFAARLFGDFGAEVILVEPPEGHPLRAEPPFLDDNPGVDRSAVHAYANWNKKSVLFTSPDELGDLLADADVLVTTSDPLVNAPYADCIKRLPEDAVHLSITAHGLDGPLSGRPGNNLTMSARTGWSFINGYRDEPPLQMPRHQSGYVGGIAGFITAAAALRRRNHGDTAELVDVSELDAFALTVHTWAIGAVYADRGYSTGAGGRRPRGEPAPLWDLADGRMHFGIADFHNWQEAMRAVGVPELADEEKYIPDIGRHSKDLRAVVHQMARALPGLERWPVFHELMRLRCVAGVMQNIEDITENEQFKSRQFLAETHVEGRTVRTAGAPARLMPSPWSIRQPAPRPGEHGPLSRFNAAKDDRHRGESINLSSQDLADGPLAGVRVLSFCQAWSGTFASELLALLGADVVQVGSLHRPDVFRRLSDQVPAGVVDKSRWQHPLNTQGQYNSVNLHKREVTLDLRQERGRELMWELLPRFDILVDNFRPTVMPSWGITLGKLHELRPGMIWASISGYGESGPYREYPANGATTEPMAGFSSLHGYEGDPGMNSGGLYPDPVSGYFMAAMVMTALHHRDRTGEPQRIDLSMMEAINVVCGDAVIEYDATGRLPEPRGNHHPRIAPHNNYPASEGEWLALAAENDEAWRTLVREVDDSRLMDSRFETMASRKANEPALDQIIGEWCAQQKAEEIADRLGALGVAASPVKTYYELYSLPDPDFRESGFVTQIDHPEAGLTWLPGRPWRFSAAPATPIRPSPCVGQHSREVLVDELGITDTEYVALVEDGITGTLADLENRR